MAYLGLMLLVSIKTTVLGYAAPDLLFGDALASVGDAAAVTHFYATRNLAVAIVCAVALLTRHPPLMFCAIVARLVIDSVDLGFTLHHGLVDAPDGLVIAGWFVVFTGPQLVCAWHLRDEASGDGWRFSIEERVEISQSAQRVWDTLSDHEAMPTWVKTGLRWVRLRADRGQPVGAPGSLRVIRFAGWPPVTERFVHVEAPRRYSYEVIEGMPHLLAHLGVVEVEAVTGGSLVRWSISFVFRPLHPLSWMAPIFVAGFRRVVASALRELGHQLESERPR